MYEVNAPGGQPTFRYSDPSKDIWVFGYNHEGTEVYVKLRLNPRRRNEIPWAIIWSFHAAEFNMMYPLRGGA